MSATPSFAPHIFISYHQTDNGPLHGTSQGWVDLLHKWLEIRLEQLMGKPSAIWRERATGGSAPTDDALPNTLHKTAILLSVISERYIASQECISEVDYFSRLGAWSGGPQFGGDRRVFRIVKTPVPRELLPAELQGTPEYIFYEEDVLNGQAQEFNPLITASGENDKRYWDKLEDLAIAVRDALLSLENHHAPTAEASPYPQSKVIYLAETTSDRIADRDKVRRDLEQHGFLVLPDTELPRTTAPELEAAVRSHLRRSRMSVHLVGSIYGSILELANDRSIPRIQQELALENDSDPEFKRVIWIPDGLQALELRQEEYIGHLQNRPDVLRKSELIRGNIENLKTTIRELLEPKRKPKVPEHSTHNGRNPARVYLIYHELDYLETKPIRNHFQEKKLEVLMPVNKTKPEDFQEHKDLLLLADAVMVYYGQANDMWSRQKLRELQKLPGYGRGKPLLAKAFYLSAPPTEDKDEFITYEADIIRSYKGFRPELVEPFISAIWDRAARDKDDTVLGEPSEMTKVKLFYSYSHKDESYRSELETHLKLMQRQGLIEAWHDRQIEAGAEWKQQIDEHMEQAQIILLLVSADFIASDYCYEKEMGRALERHQNKEARVIPIIVRDVDWQIAPFGKLQALPRDGRAVTSWENRDTAWRNVSEGIRKVVEQMRGR